MKNLLAENLLRFGAKGITKDTLQKYLIEQTAAKGLSVSQIKKLIDTDNKNRASLQKAQTTGQCVFIKSPKVVTVVVDDARINAQFYNNMVSLNRGLMPETPLTEIQSQIQDIVNKVKEQGLTNLQIEIIGTATTQPASAKPDTRLLDRDPNMQLDHPGTPYDGQEPNNDYLAKQRATSIKVVFEKLLPTAKFTVNSQVIPGGSRDDASRYIQVKIKGDQNTTDVVTVSDIWMNWTVSYEPVTGTTKSQRSNFVQGGSVAGYKATLLIEFGQKNNPVFTGKVYFESAEKQLDNPEAVIADPKRAAKASYPYLLRGAGTTNNPNFSTFLASCGYFETNTAYDIASSSNLQTRKNSIYRVDSEIFKKLAQQKQGNLQDFIRLAGGSDTQIIDATHAKFAYVYDITSKPPKLTYIK